MNEIKVTIALSVYNVAEYLRASLDSIQAQTFKDFELLCIDDASTDGTWDLLQEYALRDSRIRLIRQERNQGLSVSRNRAIAEAKGEYLLMLDGDDLFAADMVEKAYNKSIEADADMVLWDFVSFCDEKDISAKCSKPSVLLNISPEDKLSLLKRPAFSPSRMTKVSVLHDLQIHFPEGLTKQDIPVHWKLVTSIGKIALIPEYFLFYRQSPNNTTSRKGKSVFSLAYVMDITKQQLEEDGLYETYKDEFLRSRLSLLQGMYDHVKTELKLEALDIVRERLGNDELAYINNPSNALLPRVRSFYGMLTGNRWAGVKYNGFHWIRSIYRLFKKKHKS